MSDLSATTAEDTPLTVVVPLIAEDLNKVTLTIVTPPSHGTVTGHGPAWTYTPATNYNGSDSVTVSAIDAQGSATASVTITVTPVDDAPVANPDSFATGFGMPLTVALSTLLGNDTDIDSTTLTVTAVSVVTGGHGTPVITGSDVVFTPEEGYDGTASFRYTVSDGSVTTDATVTVTIGVDHAPVASDDTAITSEDTSLTIPDSTLLSNDSDADLQTLAITSVGNALHGIVTHSGTQVQFVPDADYNGPASFDYVVTDGLMTDVGTVAITVTSVNDAPVVTTSVGTLSYTENDVAAAIDLEITVSDADSTTLAGATVQITTGCTSPEDVLSLDSPPLGITVTGYNPATCTLTLAGAATVADYQAALRLVSYANTSDSPSTAGRTVTFMGDDGQAVNNLGSATRDLTVTAVDDAPVAVNDTRTVIEDSTANAIDVLANDTDVDSGARSIASITQPAHGTAAITGGGTGVTYTPAANYCNHILSSPTPPASLFDIFSYTLSPGGSTATVTVTVSCVDDPPVAINDLATVAEGSTANLINVLANDIDIDGGTDTVASVTQPTHGTAAVGPNGLSVSYTPAPGYCNQAPNEPRDLFTYTLSPGGNAAVVAMTVTCTCGLDRPTDFVVGSNP